MTLVNGGGKTRNGPLSQAQTQNSLMKSSIDKKAVPFATHGVLLNGSPKKIKNSSTPKG